MHKPLGAHTHTHTHTHTSQDSSMRRGACVLCSTIAGLDGKANKQVSLSDFLNVRVSLIGLLTTSTTSSSSLTNTQTNRMNESGSDLGLAKLPPPTSLLCGDATTFCVCVCVFVCKRHDDYQLVVLVPSQEVSLSARLRTRSGSTLALFLSLCRALLVG